MMNYARRAAQWAGGLGSPGLANRLGGATQNAGRAGLPASTAGEGRLTRGLMAGPRDRYLLNGAQDTHAIADISQRMQRRGAKRLAGAEGVRQVMGFGPLTIGGSSGTSGIQPKSSGAVGLPPPRASGGVPGSPPTA